MSTIRKLKAGLSALIKNDERLLKETKKIFLRESILHVKAEEKSDHCNEHDYLHASLGKNTFSEFLEADERDNLQDYI